MLTAQQMIDQLTRQNLELQEANKVHTDTIGNLLKSTNDYLAIQNQSHRQLLAERQVFDCQTYMAKRVEFLENLCHKYMDEIVELKLKKKDSLIGKKSKR